MPKDNKNIQTHTLYNEIYYNSRYSADLVEYLSVNKFLRAPNTITVSKNKFLEPRELNCCSNLSEMAEWQFVMLKTKQKIRYFQTF